MRKKIIYTKYNNNIQKIIDAKKIIDKREEKGEKM